MALIAIAADKGSPGVTTTSVALAAVWPRPVLLAECDPAGGDLVYRLPGGDGQRLDSRRGLLSLAVAARRGLRPHQVWEHVQKLRGGLDVLTGVTSAEHGAGLEALWGSVGAVLAALPQADVIADCGRIGVDGPYYDFLAHAAAVVMITRATLGEVVRLRERAIAVAAGVHRRGRPGARTGVVVIADHRHFNSALAEVAQSLDQARAPATVLGGLADEPKSADLLRGEWGGKLDKSLLIRTARQIAAHLAEQLPAAPEPGPAPAPRPPDHPAAPARGLELPDHPAAPARGLGLPDHPAAPARGLELPDGGSAPHAPARAAAPLSGGRDTMAGRGGPQAPAPAPASPSSAGLGILDGRGGPEAGRPVPPAPSPGGRENVTGRGGPPAHPPAEAPPSGGLEILDGRGGRSAHGPATVPPSRGQDQGGWPGTDQSTGPIAAQQNRGRRAARGRHSGSPGTDGET